jgi:hypothetical protein
MRSRSSTCRQTWISFASVGEEIFSARSGAALSTGIDPAMIGRANHCNMSAWAAITYHVLV